MSTFHRALDRLADFIWTGRKVNLRFTAEYRTACYAVPLINKLLAEGEDGDGQEHRLSQRDVLAVPSWRELQIKADTELVLFGFSDKASQEKLHIYKELRA